jgi:type 1 fimbria pilin
MKQSLTLMAAAFVLAAVSPVYAASSVDLNVTGTITPSACTPTLSAGGVVDHGKISVQDLHPNLETTMPDVTLQLAVSCEASTLVAVKSTDNRPGTSTEWGGGTSNFGLGLAGGDKKVGRYALTLINALADDVPLAMIESVDGKTWFDAPPGTVWQPGWMRSLANAADTTPVPMQSFKADVVISSTLNYKRDLPVTEEILIDGSATLDIVYL